MPVAPRAPRRHTPPSLVNCGVRRTLTHDLQLWQGISDRLIGRERRWCPIADAASTCAFDPIPAGIYAVVCFHDENKNGKLDTGLSGIPTTLEILRPILVSLGSPGLDWFGCTCYAICIAVLSFMFKSCG